MLHQYKYVCVYLLKIRIMVISNSQTTEYWDTTNPYIQQMSDTLDENEWDMFSNFHWLTQYNTIWLITTFCKRDYTV